MVVKVYFEMEHLRAAELVAKFNSEETYEACYPALYKLCRDNNWDFITESIEEEEFINP